MLSRQADQLVFANETILPSKIYNHENFKKLREQLYNDTWPSGCDTCEDMEKSKFIIDETRLHFRC